MQLLINKTEKLRGEITIPASKSHTIRAVIIAALAEGKSTLVNPLLSEDTEAAINACRAMGARIEHHGHTLTVEGWGRAPQTPAQPLDMLNSGTSTNLIMGILAALGLESEITGDASLCSRPVKALSEALATLGCSIEFLRHDGCPPLRLSGRMQGGQIAVDASKSSQYVSSLLIACPLIEQDTEINVINPTELPYIEMTLAWLDEQNIKYDRDGFSRFKIFGKQAYRPFEKTIPSDWSSAAFPIAAAAVTDSDVLVKGPDISDVQGDKAIIDYLKQMGADITIDDQELRVRGTALYGTSLDINATPDALPVLSAIGCFAQEETKLYNVAQARVKETDRITVMAQELGKVGAVIKELPAGLIINRSNLYGTQVNGHHDHRVVMAMSVAALQAEGPTTIGTAEAVSVTYPDYIESMRAIGANFILKEES